MKTVKNNLNLSKNNYYETFVIMLYLNLFVIYDNSCKKENTW